MPNVLSCLAIFEFLTCAAYSIRSSDCLENFPYSYSLTKSRNFYIVRMTERGGGTDQKEVSEDDPPENGSGEDLVPPSKKLPPGKRHLKKQESTFFGRNSMMLGDTNV